LPESGNGSAVVVCPGGAYGGLALGHEGIDIARWLTARGIAAFVLHYRLGPKYHHPTQLTDVSRAIRMVRTRAVGYGVDPDRIGVWGFSAGGHLASTAATHFDSGNPAAADPIDRASSRPDFAILSYPVITMDLAYTHQGSRENLLGLSPDEELVRLMSNETQITPETPPTFLFHTDEDGAVPAENSVRFYLGLRQAGVPAELHIYQPGCHGVGLAPNDPVLSTWADTLEMWLRGRGLLGK
jgi:acetyl esterase/lipase